MKEYLYIIKKARIFEGIEESNIEAMLNCLFPEKKSYKKGEYINHIGDLVTSIGIVLEGKVHVQKEDYWGNESIITEIGPGDTFGESYACVKDSSLGVGVLAVKDTVVLRINIKRILTMCSSVCPFHAKLISNLIALIAEKNLILTGKIEHVSQRTTRNKLLSYLSEESQKKGKKEFEIPFNRQQLADYLYVDRSAMSNELCKLRDEKIIKFSKNRFEIL